MMLRLRIKAVPSSGRITAGGCPSPVQGNGVSMANEQVQLTIEDEDLPGMKDL